MPLHRPTIEAQLQRAEQTLSAWSKALESQGIGAADFRRDPKFRRLSGRCTQIRRRLGAVVEGEAITAAVAQHKAELEGAAE